MTSGWRIDVAGATAVVEDAVRAGVTMRTAVAEVDAAVDTVVTSLAGTDVSGAARVFGAARRDDVTAAVRAVLTAVAAATEAANAFAAADHEMADRPAVDVLDGTDRVGAR